MLIRRPHRVPLAPGCVALLAVLAAACGARGGPRALTGDWDAYLALGSTPHAGFEGWRRMGFAHFMGSSAGMTGSIIRRTGETIVRITGVVARGDSVFVSGADDRAIAAGVSRRGGRARRHGGDRPRGGGAHRGRRERHPQPGSGHALHRQPHSLPAHRPGLRHHARPDRSRRRHPARATRRRRGSGGVASVRIVGIGWR